MKVLLIGFNVQEKVFPLAFNYLVEYAKQFYPDIEYEIQEFSIGNRLSTQTNKAVELQAIAYIEQTKPELLCFSNYIWSADIIQTIAENIKKILPNTKILLGGVEVTQESLSYADYIINGEGEVAFKELLDHLTNKLPIEKVSNLSYKKNNKIINNKQRQLENLDTLPFPYKKENKNTYQSVRIETSRGCPFNCKYCYYANATRPRYFSIDYLNKNLNKLFKYFTFKELTILDPNINIDFERMKQILEIIKEKSKQHKKKIKLNFELKPELITEGIITYLNKYPLEINAELGLQSTDEKVMTKCARPYNLEKVKEGLKLLDQSNIKYKIDLMYGLPEDNFYKFLNSARFLLKHAKSQNQLPAHHFMLLNNTSFKEDLAEESRINKQNSSMIVKTNSQSPLDLYKTKLFVDMINQELKLFKK